MNPESFQKIKEIVKNLQQSTITYKVSLSVHEKLVDILDDAEEDYAKELVKPIGIKLKDFVKKDFVTIDKAQLHYLQEKYSNQILKGKRPNYWPSWARKSPYKSIVVEDPLFVEYTKKQIKRGIGQLFSIAKQIANNETEITFYKGSPDLNVCVMRENFPYSVEDIFKHVFGVSELLELLTYIMTGTKAYFDDNENFNLVSHAKYTEKDHKTYTMEKLYTILPEAMKPIAKESMFEVYRLSIPELLILCLNERFPKTCNLNLKLKFFNNALQFLVGMTGSSFLNETMRYERSLFVFVPKTTLARVLLQYPEYTRRAKKLHEEYLTCSESIKEKMSMHQIYKLTNKEFFDYEAALDAFGKRKGIIKTVETLTRKHSI